MSSTTPSLPPRQIERHSPNLRDALRCSRFQAPRRRCHRFRETEGGLAAPPERTTWTCGRPCSGRPRSSICTASSRASTKRRGAFAPAVALGFVFPPARSSLGGERRGESSVRPHHL